MDAPMTRLLQSPRAFLTVLAICDFCVLIGLLVYRSLSCSIHTEDGEQPIADRRHISLDEVVRHFAESVDPRSSVNLQHPLVSVVVIASMAAPAGASGPTAIGKWASLKDEFLLNMLDLPNGIPPVSVWAGEFGLSLGQVACAENLNEITAIPERLRLVDTKGAITIIDAMGTQMAVAAQIIEGKADYVLTLKGNQETLHQSVIDYIEKSSLETCRPLGGCDDRERSWG